MLREIVEGGRTVLEITWKLTAHWKQRKLRTVSCHRSLSARSASSSISPLVDYRSLFVRLQSSRRLLTGPGTGSGEAAAVAVASCNNAGAREKSVRDGFWFFVSDGTRERCRQRKGKRGPGLPESISASTSPEKETSCIAGIVLYTRSSRGYHRLNAFPPLFPRDFK